MPLRVRYDGQIFASQAYGGISRYFVKLAMELNTEIDLKIIAPFYINEYLQDLPATLVDGRKVKNSWLHGYFGTIASHHLTRRNLLRDPPHLIHETYYSNQRSGPKSCPVIVTVYDMIHELLPSLMPSGDKTTAHKRACIQRANHVICISENTRNDFLAYSNFSPEQTSVIYLGVDVPPAADSSVRTFDFPFILYVGDRATYKNFAVVLNAIGQSDRLRKDFRIIAFGGGPLSGRELTAVKQAGLPLEAVLQISGGDAVLGRLYREAIAFVYPSLYEGFGLPPLEAMAYGCPVICSNKGSLPEVVGEAASFFDPNSADELRSVLEGVAYDSTRSEQLVAKGRERVSKFTWQKCAKQTLAVYQSFL